MDSKTGKSFLLINTKKSGSSHSMPVKTSSGSSLLSKFSPFSTKSTPATPTESPPHSNAKNGTALQEQQLFDDIAKVRTALDFFLNSNISEAEAILKPHYKDSLYYSLGYSFILYLKCVMTFQKDDINTALGVLKHTIGLASGLRKKEGGWLDSIATFIKGTTLEDVKGMTVVERHAVCYSALYLAVHKSLIILFLLGTCLR